MHMKARTISFWDSSGDSEEGKERCEHTRKTLYIKENKCEQKCLCGVCVCWRGGERGLGLYSAGTVEGMRRRTLLGRDRRGLSAYTRTANAWGSTGDSPGLYVDTNSVYTSGSWIAVSPVT